MLAVVKKYQALSDADRLIYRIGRRGGAYRSTDDLYRNPQTYQKISAMIEEMRTQKGIDAIEEMISGIGDQYL
jgi:hypothetical protein